MLSHEDNERLTRVGPGTPMGTLMRRFWLPILLASELPEADCPPVRVRLLGENLVAFRDSEGQLALVAENCPHRGASLFFGRNEEAGIRCVYHGWKFDTSGACVDMPNEPPESNFKSKVHVTAYPCVERGEIIWAYLGPREFQAAPPELEWMHVPANHRFVTKRTQDCNYLQNVEGEVDSSHVSFLHSRPRPAEGVVDQRNSLNRYFAVDRSPVFFVKPTDYGIAIGARRNADPESFYWRITQFLLPTYTMIPPLSDTIHFTSATPIDDEHMIGFTVTWHPDRPLNEADRAEAESWTGIHTEVDPVTYRPLRNRDNEYLIDREEQRRGHSYTGIRGIREEDMAVQEGMGVIYDRSREHLGTSDLAVIAMRRQLLQALRDLEAGIEPTAPTNADAYRVRSVSIVLPRDVTWDRGAAEELLAKV
jgi:phthalate 4,5-dioxygenase oxygenase subunit